MNIYWWILCITSLTILDSFRPNRKVEVGQYPKWFFCIQSSNKEILWAPLYKKRPSIVYRSEVLALFHRLTTSDSNLYTIKHSATNAYEFDIAVLGCCGTKDYVACTYCLLIHWRMKGRFISIY